MKRVIMSFLALLLLGGSLLLAAPAAKSCPGGCCTGPDDCPQPACCEKP